MEITIVENFNLILASYMLIIVRNYGQRDDISFIHNP